MIKHLLILIFLFISNITLANMRSPEYNFLTSRNIIVGPKDQGEFYVGFYAYGYGKDTIFYGIPASFELDSLFTQSDEKLIDLNALPTCNDVFATKPDTVANDTIYVSNCQVDLPDEQVYGKINVSNNGSLIVWRHLNTTIFDLKVDSGILAVQLSDASILIDKLKIDKCINLMMKCNCRIEINDLSGNGDIIKTHQGDLDINISANSFLGKYIVSNGVLKLNTENALGPKGVEVRRGATFVNNANNKTEQLVVSDNSSVVLNEDLYVNYVNIKTKDNKERHLSAGIYSLDDFDWLKGSKILHVLKGVAQTEQDVVSVPSVKMSFEDSVISAFHRVDLNMLAHSSSQICRFNTSTNGVISNDVHRLMVVYYPKTEKVYIDAVPYGGYFKYIIPDDPSHEITTVSYDDQIHYTQFILVMILTVLIESLFFLIFYRNKRDIRIVAITNVFTNLLMNFLILGIVNARPGTYAGVGNAFLLIVLEPLVWIFESILYSRKLSKTCEHYKLKAWGVAFLANVTSILLYFPLSDLIRDFSRFVWGF